MCYIYPLFVMATLILSNIKQIGCPGELKQPLARLALRCAVLQGNMEKKYKDSLTAT